MAGVTATHSDEIRSGVIGTGMMGIEHIDNIRSIDGARVTAIADTNAGSLAAGSAAAGAGVRVW